jgi:hypothetical protein
MPISLNLNGADFNSNSNSFVCTPSDKYANVIKYTTDFYLDEATSDYLAKNWDYILKKKQQIEADKKAQELHMIESRNKRLRNLVKHVNWSGNTCIVYWSDGTYTKSHWNSNEAFDPEKAILVCMARKLYQNTGIYNEVLKKYEDEGYLHHFKYHMLGLENG